MTDLLDHTAQRASAARSAQTYRFVYDGLPPLEQWPRLVYGSPELQIPDQANLVQVLFSKAVSERAFESTVPSLRQHHAELCRGV